MNLTEEQIKRFYGCYKKGSSDSCWLWGGGIDSEGYGYFCINNKHYRAHRIAAFLEGLILTEVIRHTCDVPNCVNPNHLKSGTHSDNVYDRVQRKRSAKDINNGRAKLNWSQVLAIRLSNNSVSSLARQFDVDRKSIRNIRQNKTWQGRPMEESRHSKCR